MSIIVAGMGGYSASSRRRQSRIVQVVRRESRSYCSHFYGRKSTFGKRRARECLEFIKAHADPDKGLLIYGKSLGAKHIIERVMNHPGPMRYRHVCLLTVDPNWPIWWPPRWTPNLNDKQLRLWRVTTKAINLYFKSSDPFEQAGCRVEGAHVENQPLFDVDHKTITTHPAVKTAIRELVVLANSR